MTPRQARFVQEYLLDRNGAAAAVRAGYSQHTARQIAHRLLTKADIADAVRSGEAAIATAAQASRDDVIEGLLDAIDAAQLQGEPMAMIAGWREIAKMCGYYAPERARVELSAGSNALRVHYETMSDAELVAIVADGQIAQLSQRRFGLADDG